MPSILVTGATGTVGGQVAEELLKAGGGARLCLGIRTPQKAQDLAAKGANVVAFDFAKPDTMQQAMQGVHTVFLLTPFVEDFVSLVKAALDAAKAAGVKHIVRLSVAGADPAMMGPPKQHGISDELLKQSGLAWTILQPTFFQDNLWNYSLASIQGQGVIYGAANDGKTSYVSALDIAKVACKVLQNPDAHKNKSHVLTGPEALSETEVAALLTEVMGKPIAYINLTPEQYAQGLRSNHLPEWMIDYIVALEQIKANGWAAGIASGVKDVLGVPAQSMKSYLAANKRRLL